MSKKILYCSDLHINRASQDAHTIASHLNKQIKASKASVVVFAGDISDSLSATYAFLARITAKCIFVKGNHDNYNKDDLTLTPPENVVLLENSFYETADHLFLGATLWTNLGYAEQSSEIKQLSFNRLIDSTEISNWSAEQQILENKRSRAFFENFFKVRNFLKTSARYDKELYAELSKEIVCHSKVIDLLQGKFEGSRVILEKALSSLNKKIVCVSHHAPFIEEFLLHKALTDENTFYDAKILSPKALEEATPHDIYSMQIGRTHFEDNPLELYAYFNCGFNPEMDTDVVWVHGHTHQIDEVLPVKGINIHCNPASCRYFDWSQKEVNILKAISFKEMKVDALFKRMTQLHRTSIIELIEKIEQLKSLKWADRKTTTGIDSIVFLNTIDSLRLSCDQVFKELNTVYFILKVAALKAACFANFQRFWSKYSTSSDIYDTLRTIENSIQNINSLSESLYIAKLHKNFHFIMGGATPKKSLQLTHKFLKRLV